MSEILMMAIVFKFGPNYGALARFGNVILGLNAFGFQTTILFTLGQINQSQSHFSIKALLYDQTSLNVYSMQDSEDLLRTVRFQPKTVRLHSVFFRSVLNVEGCNYFVLVIISVSRQDCGSVIVKISFIFPVLNQDGLHKKMYIVAFALKKLSWSSKTLGGRSMKTKNLKEDCGYQSFKKVFFKLPKSSIMEEFFREPTVRTIKLASGELRKRLHEELAKEALS
ncbi:hypothetical protein HUJ04_002047 [Dendroctonus ponderosae]|nr:hypothetical protein HUJ04_002047 [Dendroctonus ponderosae]